MKIVELFLLGLMWSMPAMAEYPKVEKLSFASSTSWSETGGVIENEEISIRYKTYNGNLSSKKIDRLVDKTTLALTEYLLLYDIPTLNCRDKIKLDIYHISYQVLNNKELFDFKGRLYGLYDPVIGTDDYAVIIIADNSDNEMESTLAHELSHYWYDRLCLFAYWRDSPESFASEFEEYYRKNYMELKK